MQNKPYYLGEQNNKSDNYECFSAICDNDSVNIVKYILVGEEKNCLEKQLKAIERSNNRNLVHYKSHYYYNHVLHIVFEDYKGTTLRKYINDCREANRLFKENAIRKCLICLLTGLGNLYRDKPENIDIIKHSNIHPDSVIVTIGGEYLLGEVNLIKSYQNRNSRLQELKKLYTSPLLLNGMNDDKSDIWSIGCILYELCTLNPPFTSEQIDYYCKNPAAPVVLNNLPSCYSRDLNDIIMKMLIVDPIQRISLNDLMECKYIREEIDRKYKVEELLENFLVQIPIQGINYTRQDLAQTAFNPAEKGITVENFYLGFITIPKSNTSIYDVICNNTYFTWLLDSKIKKWFMPTYEREDDEPKFNNESEVVAFRFNSKCMDRYKQIVDMILRFYGYVVKEENGKLSISSFMTDYEKRFRKWLVNVDEVHFFNRLLKSLNILIPDFCNTLKSRITVEANYANNPNILTDILKGV